VSAQDDLYQQAASEYGAALSRLALGYEADLEKRRELLQEIYLALWRSLQNFQARCSLRTWVYRVAHNTGATWVEQQRRWRPQMLVSLEELDATAVPPAAERELALSRLTELIQRLKPLDRQVILAWLEGIDAAGIGELTGLSARNAATKVHRIKSLLARNFQSGVNHAD
jgi:RNA polymerase sigma-70 factor (ECF subfamily)